MDIKPLPNRIYGVLVGHVLFNLKEELVTTCDLDYDEKDHPDHYCVWIIREPKLKSGPVEPKVQQVSVFHIIIKHWINCSCSTGVHFKNVGFSNLSDGFTIYGIDIETLKRAICKMFPKALIEYRI
jgi:hypothetical protein